MIGPSREAPPSVQFSLRQMSELSVRLRGWGSCHRATWNESNDAVPKFGGSRGMCEQTPGGNLRCRRGGRQCGLQPLRGPCGVRLRDFPLTLDKVLAILGGNASG